MALLNKTTVWWFYSFLYKPSYYYYYVCEYGEIFILPSFLL